MPGSGANATKVAVAFPLPALAQQWQQSSLDACFSCLLAASLKGGWFDSQRACASVALMLMSLLFACPPAGMVAAECGGSSFRWAEQEEERRQLWAARHAAHYAARALGQVQ